MSCLPMFSEASSRQRFPNRFLANPLEPALGRQVLRFEKSAGEHVVLDGTAWFPRRHRYRGKRERETFAARRYERASVSSTAKSSNSAERPDLRIVVLITLIGKSVRPRAWSVSSHECLAAYCPTSHRIPRCRRAMISQRLMLSALRAVERCGSAQAHARVLGQVIDDRN